MSFDILREWDLESFDPGLEFFPETERTTSLDVVTPANEDVAPEQVKFETPQADEMAREAASPNGNNFAADMVVNQGNHDFDLDFDVTEDIMAMWESESAARAQEDRDDLERERAGVGRKHERFGVNDKHSSDMNSTRRAMDAISDMQQMQSSNIHSFSGSITDNGYNFNINGKEFAMSDDEIADLARRKRLALEEEIARARASGASQDELDDLQTRLNAWTQIDDIYSSGEPITDADRADVLGIIGDNEDLQADLLAQESARYEATKENTTGIENTTAESGYSFDASSLPEQTAAASAMLDGPEEGIQTNVQLALAFDNAVMDTPTNKPVQETNPSLNNENNSGFSFTFT